VLVEHAFQDGDGIAETIVERHQQVDVVEVFLHVKQCARLLRGLTVARISPPWRRLARRLQQAFKQLLVLLAVAKRTN
jgi:hypothetical protein